MNLLWILLAAAATAWGVRAAWQRDAAVWIRVLAGLVFFLCGINLVLLVWWIGDGRLLPGWQISPDVRNWFASRYDGALPPPDPLFLIAAVLAHLALLVTRKSERGAVLWPATLVFVAGLMWFQARQSDRPISYRRTVGPDGVAFLTIAPLEDEKARVVFAHGEPGAAFARVLHVADTERVPVDTRLLWTNDGAAIILQVGRRRTFAITRDGEPIGYLPQRSHEWPLADPRKEAGPVRARLSEGAKDVDMFLQKHGGLYVR